jgi:hypothetical protein
VEDSTHDGTADSIHGLKGYGNRADGADGSASAQTPLPGSHAACATSSNEDTTLQDPRLDRTSLGRILDESSAFPKKPPDIANGELGDCPREDERVSTVSS